MTEPTVLYFKQGPMAHVVLNRPEVVNAYNMQMRDDLFQALEAVRDDPDVRVCVVRGAGDRGFCAGADLTEFGKAPSQVVARQVRWERDVWGLLLGIAKPLVAALHGHVIGSGVEIACACDVRIASDHAVFRMPEVALGMIPAAGGTQTLPRIMGAGSALEMLLTNRQLAATEALRLGLVHKVVARDALLMEAERIAETLASRDPAAIAAVKTAITTGLDVSLAAGLALEARLAARLIAR